MKLYATRVDNVQCFVSLWIIALPITKGQVCCTDFTLDGCSTRAIHALFHNRGVLSNFDFHVWAFFLSLSGCTLDTVQKCLVFQSYTPLQINLYQEIPCMKELRFWKRQVLVWWCFWVKILLSIHFDENVMFLVEKLDFFTNIIYLTHCM